MTEMTEASRYIHAGDVVACMNPTRLITILGSCIAVCLYDPGKKIGGMNHFLFPFTDKDSQEDKKSGRFAMEQLFLEMKKLGSLPGDLRAKVFGGSRLTSGTASIFASGQHNLEFALKFLNNKNIPIIAQDTGGARGRKIQFNTASGEVLVNYLKN